MRGLGKQMIAGVPGGEGAVQAVARLEVRALADGALRYLQTGFTQSYVLMMIIGAVVVIGYIVR